MTLNFQYTAEELRDAERWPPGMGPVWRSVFISMYLSIAVLTLAVGLAGARTDVHRTIGPRTAADAARHLKNLCLLLLPTVCWLSVIAASVVASSTGRFSRHRRFIDDSRRVPRRSITRPLLWGAFILMAAAHELFVSFSPARLHYASVADQLRDRLPGVSLALVVCAGVWPLLVLSSFPRARAIRHGLGRPKQVEIDDKGITFSDPASMFHYPWFRIKAIVETPGGYLVFDKPLARTFRLIPRRAFATPEEEAIFRQTLFDWAAIPTGGFQVIPVAPPSLSVDIGG